MPWVRTVGKGIARPVEDESLSNAGDGP
jgi:hypothetical protein